MSTRFHPILHVALCLVTACGHDWSTDPERQSDASSQDGGARDDAATVGDAARGDAEPNDAAQGDAGPNDVDASEHDGEVLDAAGEDAGCPTGTRAEGSACIDIDECLEGSANCHQTATCANTQGGYDCTCKPGYSGGGPLGIACLPRITVGGDSSGQHSCAITPQNQVKCWGSNTRGQLGDGTTDNRTAPTLVDGLTDAAFVVAGIDTTCAVLRDRTVRCWGGAAGPSWGVGATRPTQLGGLSDVVHLSLSATGCAVTAAGAVFCWGDNSKGQVGNGQTAGIPVARPLQVGGLSEASWVSTSPYQPVSCAGLRSGAAYCWGEGALTSPSQTSSTTPVAIPNIVDALDVLPLFQRTCVRRYSGTITCWGTPALIARADSGPGYSGGMAVDFAGGLYQSCLLNASGAMSCWNASTTSAAVADGTGLIAIAARFARTWGLTATGTLKCWNMNSATPAREAGNDVVIW